MFYLAYVSAATVRLDQQELESLLATCRRNNDALAISGVLVYADGSFMQVLEGEEQTVRTLYARIERDPRHHDLIVLDEGDGSEREFGEWSMAFRDLSGRLDEVAGFEDLMTPIPTERPDGGTRLGRLVRSARKSLKKTL